MGGGAAGDGEGYPAVCLGDGRGGVPLGEEVIGGVNKWLAGDVLALACSGGGSVSWGDEGGLLSGHTSDIIARGGGEGGGGDEGPPEECEEEGVGGDCALGVQKGSCGGAACHVLAMACVGGGAVIGEDERGLPSGRTSVISVLVGE